MDFKKVKYQHLLVSVLKPARYINKELNSYHKPPSQETVNFCLAFPDVYEVGFSNLGLKILYTILNEEPDTIAERVYAPWPDFGELLKIHDIPLFAIESSVALKEFDFIGFTLQTELTYTNILYILELSQIPFFSNDRSEQDPLIFAGGPGAVNPEPLADFFDGFLIGDGEEAIIEIKNSLKKDKQKTRLEKLKNLGKIEGVYIPQLYKENDGKIKARKFMDFDNKSKIYKTQLVPWMMPTHYRFISEIMRGCSRSCRFCFAGMFYRPVRERDPQVILNQLIKEVKKYGWEEAALTSLSSSDYTCIKPLLMEIYKNLNKTGLSLPSLRVDSIDDELTKLMNAMRQTGLTIAPEAGSQRLRDIINKNITEVEIFRSVEIALKNGWKLIKLYFMIGLPFEEDADIDALIELIYEIILVSQKKIKINITISPFVPKPFTPFQWSKMEDKDILLKKIFKIKNTFQKYRFIKIKYHEIDGSILECVIGRGDRKIGKLIYEAYRNGAIFDAWDEHFCFEYWEKAAKDEKIDFNKYLSSIPVQKKLFWDYIDIGIKKEFLKTEWGKAKQGITTEDCRTGKCTDCGVCSDKIAPKYAKELPTSRIEVIQEEIDNAPNYYYRVFYQQMNEMQFVSHLDIIRMIYNVLRASELLIVFTKGFNIHPMLRFGPPLSIGVQGRNEYFDLAMKDEYKTDSIFTKLEEVMPEQLKINQVIPITDKKMLMMEYYQFEQLTIIPPKELKKQFEKYTNAFLESSEFKFTRIRKGKEKTSDLKEIIKEIQWDGSKLEIIKKIVGASIFDILRELYHIEREETNNFVIIRNRLLEETQ